MGGYGLGVDLGTTWTAAAVVRDGGRPEMVALGGRAAAVPTVVALQPEGWFAVGDAAVRRAASDPDRTGREFKRRVGDTAPILLGGSPYSPESLLATVLWWVVNRVTEQEGGPPDRIVVTHPANWGVLRRELLEQAIAHAGMTASLTTEPEAAALHYASQERVPDGTVVAVYDLGGGTFDATVLRKTPAGFEVLGRPSGVERLGGVDFDAAVLGHITGQLGPAWTQLDPDDAGIRAAVGRLRDDCIEAKEALSEDPAAVVPVNLPTIRTEVRVTRAELEGMIRPSVEASADALARAIADAGLQPADVDRIILVGGSSRIPLVAQVLTARFGRPLAVDTHPKHAVALGAARLAAGAAAAVAPPPPAPAPTAVAPLAAVPPVAPDPVPVTAGPAPPARSRTPLLAGVGAFVVLAVLAAVLLTRGGGGGGDGGEAGGATTTSFELVDEETPVLSDDERLPALFDVASLTVQASLEECSVEGCEPGSQVFFVPVGAGCLVSSCTLTLGGADGTMVDDGEEIVARGPATGDLACGDGGDGTFEARVTIDPQDPASFTGTVATTCDDGTRVFDLAVVPDDGSVAGIEALEGAWFVVTSAEVCDGLSEQDCARFQADDGFSQDFVIDCDDDTDPPTCTVRIGNSDPAELFDQGPGGSEGALFSAGGVLSDTDGFACDGRPDPTAFDFNVVDVQLGDDGRATTIEVQFVLQSEGGDVDGNSCVPERVEATGVADPA